MIYPWNDPAYRSAQRAYDDMMPEDVYGEEEDEDEEGALAARREGEGSA